MRSLRLVVMALGAVGLIISFVLLLDYTGPLMRIFHAIIDALSK